MLKKISSILFILLLISTVLHAQRMLKISVSISGQEKHLSYISRNGMSYVSAIDLCKVLGAGSYYNADANKVEMKFDNYKLKVTGRNQFFILTSKSDNSQQVYQIPISTLLMRNDVFLPLTYSLKFIKMAYGQEIIFNEKEKHLSVTGKPISSPIAASQDKSKDMQPADDESITFTPTKRPTENVNSSFGLPVVGPVGLSGTSGGLFTLTGSISTYGILL